MQYLAWLGGVLRGDLGWSGVAAAPVSEVLPDKLHGHAGAGAFGLLIADHLGRRLRHVRRRPAQPARRPRHPGRGDQRGQHAAVLVRPAAADRLLPGARRSRRSAGATAAIFAGIAHPTGLYTVDAILSRQLDRVPGRALASVAARARARLRAARPIIARMMRSSLVEELREDYVDAARAKGLPERLVLRRHARRNALDPDRDGDRPRVRASCCRARSSSRSSSAGRASVGGSADAVLRGDQATIMAYVLFTSVLFLLVNLVVDVVYAYLDRRVVLGAHERRSSIDVQPPTVAAAPASGTRCLARSALAARSGSWPPRRCKPDRRVIGVVIIVLLIGMALFAPVLVEPNTPDPYQMPRDWAARQRPPGTPGHPLGHHQQGRRRALRRRLGRPDLAPPGAHRRRASR